MVAVAMKFPDELSCSFSFIAIAFVFAQGEPK